MKILLLANPNSPHTVKWARALADRGLELCIFGLSNYDNSLYQNHTNIRVFSSNFHSTITEDSATKISKLIYLKATPAVKKMIAGFKPDLVHAHYASSYGLLGALAGFHPFVLSVWGGDIFDFPNKSFLHRELIKFNLQKADKILSTSHIMAKETGKYTRQAIEVTPFGIDLNRFRPMQVESIFGENDIVIGTIKWLDQLYGIEFLLKAFKILETKYSHLPLRLLIVGSGPLEKSLKDLAKTLGIESKTVFTGRVNIDEVPQYHNMLTVFVSLSVGDSDSFGVVNIEASACEKPVVVANVGGLPEVVADGITGFVVPLKNPEKAAAAIEKLILDKDLRLKMGRAGRERVAKLYNWKENVEQMINIYESLLRK